MQQGRVTNIKNTILTIFKSSFIDEWGSYKNPNPYCDRYNMFLRQKLKVCCDTNQSQEEQWGSCQCCRPKHQVESQDRSKKHNFVFISKKWIPPEQRQSHYSYKFQSEIRLIPNISVQLLFLQMVSMLCWWREAASSKPVCWDSPAAGPGSRREPGSADRASPGAASRTLGCKSSRENPDPAWRKSKVLSWNSMDLQKRNQAAGLTVCRMRMWASSRTSAVTTWRKQKRKTSWRHLCNLLISLKSIHVLQTKKKIFLLEDLTFFLKKNPKNSLSQIH